MAAVLSRSCFNCWSRSLPGVVLGGGFRAKHEAVALRPSERATDARAFISVEIEARPLVLAMGVGIFLATLPPPARRETPAVPG